MKHFRVIPDNRIDNRTVEQMAKTLNIYKNPFQRWNGRGFDLNPFFSFEVKISKDQQAFYFTIPDDMERITTKALETTWPQAQIELCADPYPGDLDAVTKIELKHHSMFAIRVDRRENKFMHSLMEIIKVLKDDDELFIQILSLPASLDWYTSCTEAYKEFKDGRMPKKWHVDSKELAREGMKVVARGVLSVMDTLVTLTGGEPEKINLDDSERAVMMRDGGLRSETLNKPKSDAYDVVIRLGIKSKDHENIAKMISGSFREFDGDNYFINYPLDVNKLVDKWFRDRKPGFRISKDYLTSSELARIIQMPNGAIQNKWGIECIGKLETSIDKKLTSDGILIGSHKQKGISQDVFIPTNDWDELTLPRIAIGGMGQGKTKGFGANWIYEAVRNGFGGLAIDPAKGEIGNELESVLDADQIIRINVFETPISLDWCECEYSDLARNRLANTMISFFNSNSDDAGFQTQRYIRALVMGMLGSKLKEMIKMLNDMSYLAKCVERMPDGIHRSTLEELINYSDGRRMQIISPILNRLDMILGDAFLERCMDSTESIDMVDLLQQKKAIIIDVKKSDIGKEAVEVIVNMLSTKIDIAMTLRPEEHQTPFWIVFDEPHQYLKSHHTWQSACVESRKYRLGYIWMFHEWTQLDDKLRKVIKSALPHYHIYPSSKSTFNDLKEELKPFDLDDCMKLKRWTAINVIRHNGETITPFVASMSKPPSERIDKKCKNNVITWTIPS